MAALHHARAWLAASLLIPAALAAAGPKEDNEQAEKEFARGNLVVSLSLWRKAAEAGYAPAQAWLGDILDKSEEDEEAVSWFRKAAAQGDAHGEYGLGQMYAKGEGVKQDFEQARLYIGRAAGKDYLPAVVLMREMFKNGTMGMPPDPVKAAQWESKVQELAPKPAAVEKK